jgi:type I restriction enzyme M protein
MQHMLYHLSPTGVMATVLSNGSLSSNTSGEGAIRKNLVDANLVECIVALPKQLFYNTGIPACIWFLRRKPTPSEANEVLFIDASEMGYMKDRVHRNLSDTDDKEKQGDFDENGLGDIQQITKTYHTWRAKTDSQNNYEDIKGYCKSANIEAIQKHNYVLTPGRYVGIPDEEDDGIPFETKMADLTGLLKEQMDKEAELNQEIKTQLSKIGFSL